MESANSQVCSTNGTPQNRCGYTTNHTDPVDSSQSPPKDNVVCWRKTWKDHEFCIWHADEENKPAEELISAKTSNPERLDGAILKGVEIRGGIDFSDCKLTYSDLSEGVFSEIDFSGANISWSNLSNTDFGASILRDVHLHGSNFEEAILNAANLENARGLNSSFRKSKLRGANLTGAWLMGVDFTEADFWEANLKDADLSSSNFRDSSLARANLTGTFLGGADLRGAAFSYGYIDDAEINEGTKFGGKSQWEVWSDQRAAESIPYIPFSNPLLRILGRPFTYPDDLEQAELQYRATQRTLRENDLRELPELAVREKHARRKKAVVEREYWSWIKFAFYRWPLGYGEKVRNVIVTSLTTIVLFGLIYPYTGGMESTGEQGETFAFDNVISVAPEAPEMAEIIWSNLYFSAVTFSTLGYGDIHPASKTTQALASVEALLGALLMAYLVFVLGRRTTW